MSVKFATGKLTAVAAVGILICFEAPAKPFQLWNGYQGNGNVNGSNNSNSGGNQPDQGSSVTGESTTTSLFGNLFIGGRGSYDGGLLLGETLQSQVNPFLQNSGSASEVAWVESLVTGTLPALPTGSLSEGIIPTGNRLYSFQMPAGWDYAYVMAKWGGAHNESDHAVWYLTAGQELKFQLPNELSHATLWAPSLASFTEPPLNEEFQPSNLIVVGAPPINVPDTSATWALMGGGLFLLGLFRRVAA
jgi:hypothetical protein